MPSLSSDPTTLTTAQLVREIASLKELLIIRIDAVEKAQESFQDNLTRVPTEVDKTTRSLRELLEVRLKCEAGSRTDLALLIDEKLAGVQKQFDLLDKGIKEKADLANLALSAALSAQEKSVQKQNEAFSLSSAKTETAFTKLLDQQAVTVQTLGATLNDKLNDLKGSQTLTEGKSGGQTAAWGWIVGIVGLLLAFASAVIAAFAVIHK